MSIQLAQQVATLAHKDQFRRDGKTPYINHPQKVAELAASLNLSDQAIQAAWLHDTLEDTNLTSKDLVKAGFPKFGTVAMVEALTKKEEETYFDFIKRIKATSSYETVCVKICDIVANLTDSPTQKQIEKYTKALTHLAT